MHAIAASLKFVVRARPDRSVELGLFLGDIQQLRIASFEATLR